MKKHKSKGPKRRRIKRPVVRIPKNTIGSVAPDPGPAPERIQAIAPDPGAVVGSVAGAEVKAVRVYYLGISTVKTIFFITNQERDLIVKKFKQETGIEKIEILQGGKREIIKI